MKKIILTALFALAIPATALVKQPTLCAQSLYVGSYNIRYKNRNDSVKGNGWQLRCPVIAAMINFESPDIWGAQEVLHTQLQDLLAALDGYEYIGVGREDGKTKGEYAPIFYKKDRLRLLDSGHFWLSETPDSPSKGWDAACERICTWGKFVHNGSRRHHRRANKPFYFFNLHMDHIGAKARREAAKLVIERIKALPYGTNIILTGDFNVDQNDEIYQLFVTSGILKDTYSSARLRFAENGTFTDYKQDFKTFSRIDHVFVSPQTHVDRYGILTNSYWTDRRRNPSDHYPVMVWLDF